MASWLSAPHFHHDEAAYRFVEARLWPNGPVCPHCGGVERISKMQGKSTRVGAYKCYQCRKPFTVKIGTIFEDSKVHMHLWLQAMYLIAGSKKGISSNQLHRILGVTLKTAWFMSHRIREAMKGNALNPFGSDGGFVEVDETFIGNQTGKEVKPSFAHKMKVLSLIERNTGQARSYVIDKVSIQEIDPILARNVSDSAHLMTDEARVYLSIGAYYAQHSQVNHSGGEYGRGDLHTNTIEGFFSIFKRGMKGVYQHCQEKHLHRYLAEFDFRYSNRVALGCDDAERAERLLLGVIGKRLTYNQSCARA
jgi:transposase-like protein